MTDLFSRSAWRKLRAAAALASFLAASPAIAAAPGLAPGFPDAPMAGPAKALGAVLWSHGKAPKNADSTDTATPAYVEVLREAGWDVFRMNRTGWTDNVESARDRIDEGMTKLKGMGYSRIVLAGQSYGAWGSIDVAGRRDDVFAVVAVAPAAYGEAGNSMRYWNNAEFLYPMAEELKPPTRVLVAVFRDDAYDPGGRGPKLQRILAGRRLPFIVVDQPADLVGHGAGNTYLFKRRFGPCIAAFVDPASAPPRSCEAGWGTRPTGEVGIDRGLRAVPPPPETPRQIAMLSGRWWGWLSNGREVEILVERIVPEKAELRYGVGPTASARAAVTRLEARGTEKGLVATSTSGATITLTPSGTGAALRWESGKGDPSLSAALVRVD